MTRIYYFSGTGNGLAIARGIAEEVGGAELVDMGKAKPGKVPAGTRVGVAAPVYFLDLPPFVADFLGRLELGGGNACFGVVSMGAMKGNALRSLRKLLLGRGAESFAGYSVRMPDNSVIFPSKEAEIPGMLEAADREIARIGKRVAAGDAGDRLTLDLAASLFGKPMAAYSYRVLGFGRMEKDDKCIGCGVCARHCPVGNIEMKDGMPVWKETCPSCFSCVHRCPVKSAGYRKMKRKNLLQYVHPRADSPA